MYTKVTEYDFTEAFKNLDRVSHFQYDGLAALFNYLSDLEQDTGESYELDVIALCCDFSRFDSIEDYNEQYSTKHTSMDDVDEFACQINHEAFICYAH